MKNLKIGTKLFVTFSIVFLVTIILALFSILGLQQVANQFTVFHEGPYVITTEAMNMRRLIAAAERSLLLTCSTDDDAIVQGAIDQCSTFLNELNNGIAVLKDDFTGDQTLITDFETYVASTNSVKERIFELTMNDKNSEAFQVYAAEYQPMMDHARIKLENIGKVANDNAGIFYANALASENTTSLIIIVLALLSLGIIVFLSVFLSRLLTRPIQEIAYAARQMAAGTLDVSIGYRSNDEFGVLAENMRDFTAQLQAVVQDQSALLADVAGGNLDVHSAIEDSYVGDFKALLFSLRKIVTDLSHTIKQITEASGQVSSGSDQVSSGAQALSQGATEQASSVEELAATVAEIYGQIKDTATNARQANQQAGVAGSEVEACNGKMQELNVAMGEITESSRKIRKIIKTIEDIAFQTNILALNAAVEAARAGVAGKGFAVVADEVRSLASKSAEAAKDTTSLIEGSLLSVENGTRLTEETTQSLQQVVTYAQAVVSTVNKISAATDEQATSMQQVSQGIDQISSVVQTNSATAQQSAAASEELNSQAQLLNSLVQHFRLREERTTLRSDTPRSVSAPASYSSLGGSSKY